jgi:hypothetical protein
VKLQEYELNAPVRLKFASMRGWHVVGDASVEYGGFFDALPNGWQVVEEGSIETISEHSRSARRLKYGEAEVVAVEHETGLELLVVDLAVNIAASAIVGLTVYLWGRWKTRRDATRADRARWQQVVSQDALTVERTVDSPDGTRVQQKLVVPASVLTDERFAVEIRRVLTAASANPSVDG